MKQSSAYCPHCKKQVMTQKDKIGFFTYLIISFLCGFAIESFWIDPFNEDILWRILLIFRIMVIIGFVIIIINAMKKWKCSQCGCEVDEDSDSEIIKSQIKMGMRKSIISAICSSILVLAILFPVFSGIFYHSKLLPLGYIFTVISAYMAFYNRMKPLYKIKKINAVLLPIITENYDVLSRKYNKLVEKGEYGELIFDKWYNEIDHFIDTVVNSKNIKLNISREHVINLFEKLRNTSETK